MNNAFAAATDPDRNQGAPEQPVSLPAQTPVYLTCITAAAIDQGIAFRDDVYGRDGADAQSCVIYYAAPLPFT